MYGGCSGGRVRVGLQICRRSANRDITWQFLQFSTADFLGGPHVNLSGVTPNSQLSGSRPANISGST